MHKDYKLTGGGIDKRGFGLFVVLLLAYCASVICFSRYTFNLDDIWMWLEIYRQHPIFNGYNPSSGRFFPLASMDLNIIAHFSQSPYIFFTFNALICFSIAILLWICFSVIIPLKRHWRIGIIFCLMLHPGFVTIMLGICYPERLQVLFLLIFMLSSLYFYKHTSLLSAILGLVSANIALYYKEPTFLIIGTFGLIMAIFQYKRGYKVIWYYVACALSAVLFLGLYIWLIMPNVEHTYAREIFLSPYESLLYTLKGIFNFILNDSPLLLLLPILLVYRAYRILLRKEVEHIFWDSLLLGGFLYVCAFIKLNLFESYYLIPVYFVSLGAMLYFLCTLQYIQKCIFKSLCMLCGVLICLNSLPSGIYQFVWLKVEGVKFHNALNFIANLARKEEKLVLYFYGNGRGEIYNAWYYIYFARYLEQLYNVHNFDVRTQSPNSPTLWEKERLWGYNANARLSIFNSDKITQPQSKDIIILHNSTAIEPREAYKALSERYKLIYMSKSLSLPYIALKPLLKICFAKSQTLQDATRGNANPLKLPLRDYIFEVP